MARDIDLLIQECKKGNQKSQLQFYRLYSEAMYFIACRYINNEQVEKVIEKLPEKYQWVVKL